jgi:hypothetical protein
MVQFEYCYKLSLDSTHLKLFLHSVCKIQKSTRQRARPVSLELNNFSCARVECGLITDSMCLGSLPPSFLTMEGNLPSNQTCSRTASVPNSWYLVCVLHKIRVARQ